MTHEKKIEYLKIATGICHFGINHKDLDLLISLYELIMEKKGNADMMDCAKIIVETNNREEQRKTTEILDRHSTKK